MDPLLAHAPRDERRFAADPHRPVYHFAAPRHWLNDPNGLLHWQGKYHLFYQHNPKEAVWGNMTWGHAVSTDLLRWRDLPHALAPVDAYDKDGVFSGCCVVDPRNGTPTIVYTGVDPQTQCLATPLDAELVAWKKHPGNPVIADIPEGFGPGDLRDPFVWRDERANKWKMVLGTRTRGNERGAVLLYEADDLASWRFVGPLLAADDAATQGRIWECPNFFPLGDGKTWVLIVSLIPHGTVIYFTGSFDGTRFDATYRGRLDLGPNLYAPLTFLDARGRRLLVGWINEARPAAQHNAAGWAGAMTLPRVLSLGNDGTLRQAPAEEADGLPRTPVDDLAALGRAFEVRCTLTPGRQPIGLVLKHDEHGREQTRLLYDPASSRLVLDRSRSTMLEGPHKDVREAELRLPPGEPLDLRVFFDGSLIEAFVGDRACLTARVYPSVTDATGVEVIRGNGKVTRLEAWRIASIWA